jgi:hypothetical protein
MSHCSAKFFQKIQFNNMLAGDFDSRDILFWNPKFWQVQESSKGILVDNDSAIRWEVRENTLSSGYVGYFGGYNPYLYHSGNNHQNLDALLQKSERFAKSQNLNALEIRMPPIGYFPELDNGIYKSLTILGWQEIKIDIFSFIRSDADLEVVMRKNRKYDVHWWEKKNPIYESGVEFIPTVYKVISDNFDFRGRINTTPQSILEGLAKNCPDSVQAHLLRLNNEVLSVAITLKIHKSLLHIFKWANNPLIEENFPSSLPLLFKRMFENYEGCPQNIICLGTSSENGNLNTGLLNFKKSLGFLNCERKIWRKNLVNKSE